MRAMSGEDLPATASSEGSLAHRLARVLQVALGAGLTAVVVGSAIEIARRGHLGRTTVPFAKLGAGLAAFDGSALLTLGLIILLVAPATGLAYLVVALSARRDRLHALIAGVVLAILLGSMFVKGAL
jgi:uncharacterized membrane protein